jgi:glyoxylase I family protein
VTIDVFGVEHLDLTINDIARSAAFYDQVLGALGFRKLETPAGDTDVRWGNAHLTIAIRPASSPHRGAEFDRYRVGLHHLALRTRTRADVDEFHRFLLREKLAVLDAPAEYPQYGPNYYAVFFADPDGIKLELAHFPWGYWRKAMTEGRDERPRHASKSQS